MFLPTLGRHLARLRWPASRSRSTLRHRDVALASGERLALELRAGETLLVLHGAVTLHLPATWLGETLVTPRAELREGEIHAARERQIVTLAARAASRLRRV